MKMRRKKPTNKEIVQLIDGLNNKINYETQQMHNLVISGQNIFYDFIRFLKKEDQFKKFIEDKYKENEKQQNKDTKKSS
jgi:hypothetical protein